MLTATTQPLLKWAGSKRQILDTLLLMCPTTYDTYYEPFLGSGALFFALAPKKAVLSDVNKELIECYTAIRNQASDVIRALSAYENTSEYFYSVRTIDPRILSPVDKAARMLFLNRTCYNGLYRVNKSGRFNVPFGRYRAPKFYNPEHLLVCAAALQKAELLDDDFEFAAMQGQSCDFMYLNPPFMSELGTKSFTEYTATGFDYKNHERLRAVIKLLTRVGVKIMLSAADLPQTRALYAGFNMHTVPVARLIGASPANRYTTQELIIRNYTS